MPVESKVDHKLQIYTPHLLWGGVLALGAHRRLSDFINDAQLTFLEISRVTLNKWDQRTGELAAPFVPHSAALPGQAPASASSKNDLPAAPIELGESVVFKRNIIALVAYTEPTQNRGRTLDRVPKVPRRMGVHAPPLFLEGSIHFLHDMTWQEGFAALHQDFFSLTDATIWCSDTGVRIVPAAEFVMVNRAWISGIHPTGPDVRPAANSG